MARRGILTVFLVFAVVAGAATQSTPFSRLLITDGGLGNGQSLLYGVDTGNGRVSTLFNGPQGTLLNLTMDLDNVGIAVAYQGRDETGIHFFRQQGASGLAITKTERHRKFGQSFLSVNLTSEACWIVGSNQNVGYGRLRVLVPGYELFYEIEKFQNQNVSELVVERKTAKFILALNGAGGGVVYSYSPYNQSRRSTLASGLGTITDLFQDPGSDGFLVASRNPMAPIYYVGDKPEGQNVIKSFSFPVSQFPSGVAVDAMAIDAWGDDNENYVLWVVALNRLYRLKWNSDLQTIVFPPGMPYVALPVTNPTGMIFEGDRDYLLTAARSTNIQNDPLATLNLRLGPQYSHMDYYIAASLSMSPGIPVNKNRMINLAPDPLYHLSLSGLLPMVFEEFRGDTGPDGEVTGKLIARKEWKDLLKGLTVFVAGVVIDPAVPSRIRTVTNTVGLTLF